MLWVVVLAPAKLKVLSVFIGSCPARPIKEVEVGAKAVRYGFGVRFGQGGSYSTLQGRRGRVPENNLQSS